MEDRQVYWQFREDRNRSACKDCILAKFDSEGVYCFARHVESLCGAKECEQKMVRKGFLTSREIRYIQLNYRGLK